MIKENNAKLTSVLEDVLPSEKYLYNLLSMQIEQRTKKIDILSVPVIFSMLALPYKELKNKNGKITTFEKTIIRNNKKYTLRINSGVLKDEDITDSFDKIYGIPYGVNAKLIYLYLFNQIKLKKSKRIFLGSTYREILTNIKIIKKGEIISGSTRTSFNKQLERVINCSLTFEIKSMIKNKDSIYTQENQLCFPFIKERVSLSVYKEKSREKKNLGYYLTVSDEVYEMIINNPFTVFDSELLHLFKKCPLAFSLSLFFSYWSYISSVVSKRDLLVSYESLYEQFGSMSTYKKFKENTIKAINKVNSNMPFLKLNITKKGIVVEKMSLSSITISKTKLAEIVCEDKYERIVKELK